MTTPGEALLVLLGSGLVNERISKLERFQAESHALLSARVSLTWTAVNPVNADLTGTFLPLASRSCSFVGCTVDSSGLAPLIYTRWKLNTPLAFEKRATMLGTTLLSQGNIIPPNPIVGVIAFPTALDEGDDACTVVNVVNNLLTPGTVSTFEVHVNMRRGVM